MAKSVTDRVDNWTARMQGEAVSASTQRCLAQQAIRDSYANAQTSLVAMELVVRGELNGAGVPTIQYPFYLCFGRELWSLASKGYSLGEANGIGNGEAAILMAKWEARGLEHAVLMALLLNIFGMGLGGIPAPVRTAPLNNVGINLPYTFTWGAVSGATKYDLVIYADGSGVIAYEDNAVATNSKLITSTQLPVAGLYSWTVRAFKVTWGPFAYPKWNFFSNPSA